MKQLKTVCIRYPREKELERDDKTFTLRHTIEVKGEFEKTEHKRKENI